MRLAIGPNAALLVGHGTVRRFVMKDDYKRPANTRRDRKNAQTAASVVGDGR